MHKISIMKPYFHLIKEGKKTIEGRKNSIKYHYLKVGDEILFNYNDETCLTIITKINKYTNIREYLKMEKLEDSMPNIKTIKEGLKIFNNIYSNDIIDNLNTKYGYGFLSIHIKLKY